MTEIIRLTDEQQEKVAEYRKRYWKQAISTEPADRERAEIAVKKLMKMGGVDTNKIIWAVSPRAGRRAHNKAWASLKDSFKSSFNTSVEPLAKNFLWDPLWDLAWKPFCASLISQFSYSLKVSLIHSPFILFETSVNASFGKPLWSSLRDSLWALLWHSLRLSLKDQLHASFNNSPWNLLIDSPSIAYYNYAVDVLNIKVSDKIRKLLTLRNELAASCFALWPLPGQVVLCERPKAVKINDGQLMDITWRKR